VWTNELLIGDEDSSMDFEKRALFPHPLAKYIKVSKTLVRKAAINIEALVRERLAYKVAVTEEQAFLTGTGVNRPLGVMTASDSGITTGRDVSTGNTTTQIKADGLIECKYSLESQYRTNMRWIFHRDAIKMIRKLKDGEGNYLWKPGISSDRPDTILDFPVHESEYQNNTFTTGLYVGILGDFSYYWIADSLAMTLEVLVELYAANNQVGYVLRAETDAAPVHEKAFARVKLA
jgi:HK97 family phage major capsid protein